LSSDSSDFSSRSEATILLDWSFLKISFAMVEGMVSFLCTMAAGRYAGPFLPVATLIGSPSAGGLAFFLLLLVMCRMRFSDLHLRFESEKQTLSLVGFLSCRFVCSCDCSQTAVMFSREFAMASRCFSEKVWLLFLVSFVSFVVPVEFEMLDGFPFPARIWAACAEGWVCRPSSCASGLLFFEKVLR